MQKVTTVKKVFQDDSELLYMTMVGVAMAAIFATGLHADVDRTLTLLAPKGTEYPFPAQTRLPAAKLTAAIGGFMLGVFFWTIMGKLRWAAIGQLLKYRNWLTNPKHWKTKAWYYCLATLLPRKRFLYTFQHVLPKYPLPTLESTCKKTLETIRPLINVEEYEEIEKELKRFEKGEGQVLQKILEKRYQTEHNWVADLWDKYAYLSFRSPVYHTNFCNQGALKKLDISACEVRRQLPRAANLIYHNLKFYQLIQTRSLKPLLVQDLVPICSYRYRYPFATTRIPGQAMDELVSYENSKHIIVIRKGIMYKVDVVAIDITGEESILSGPEIQALLEDIMLETANLTDTQWNPSVFTAQSRTTWAQDRDKMMTNSVNKASLHEVESAIFHVVLEDSSPQNLTEETHSNLCGDGFNRWFDKSLTVTVYENGTAGGNVEHSTADATLTSRILEYVWGSCMYDGDGDAWTPDAQHHPIINAPVKISWDLVQFQSVIPGYKHNHNLFRLNLDVRVMKCMHGKGAIKKLRVSPDGFMQMALQLAFYRMHKTVPKTYESAMTRFFKYGRTETIRTVSTHSVAFTKAMDDPNCSRDEVLKQLKAAIKYHHIFKLEAMNGEAPDRHMFGLYVASKFAGIRPKIFDTKILSDYDQLSTSQSPYFFDKTIADKMDVYPAGGAFAAMREDGYGVYYLFLGDNFLTVHITSYRSCPETDSTLFGRRLEEAIADMKNLIKK